MSSTIFREDVLGVKGIRFAGCAAFALLTWLGVRLISLAVFTAQVTRRPLTLAATVLRIYGYIARGGNCILAADIFLVKSRPNERGH